MNKNNMKAYIVLGIFFVLISIIAFAVPTEKTDAFWTAYAFTAFAFVAQIIIWRASFSKGEKLKSKFLGFPVAYIGIIYLILQTLAFFIFLFAAGLPTWSAVVICAIITGISTICMVSTESIRGELERVEEKAAEKVFYIKSLQTDVELIAERESNPEIKKNLKALEEKIRFSDPMSDDGLKELEEKIAEKTDELKNSNDKSKLITEISQLLSERNKKCKLLK